MPFYAAPSSYYTIGRHTNRTVADPVGFHDLLVYFFIWMGVLGAVYLVCVLRFNVILCIVLFSFFWVFPLLKVSYFFAAQGYLNTGKQCRMNGPAFGLYRRFAGMVALLPIGPGQRGFLRRPSNR